MGFVTQKKSAGFAASRTRYISVLSEINPFPGKITFFKKLRAENSGFSRISASGGFTLIELLIVIVIIGIIMSAAMMNSIIARDKARIAGCKATMDTVKKGLEAYMTDNSMYPAQGDISSYNDIITLMKENVDLTPKITCEEPFTYTANAARNSYHLETRVHYLGGSGGGVKIILEDGVLTDEPI
jgi:prepilin-type N-terminal cleavage/methylation domain-containing protein